jgi:hypothetical protein
MSSVQTDPVAFDRVLTIERDELNRRRSLQGLPLLSTNGSPDAGEAIIGLALSGGGIRAAALGLGAIQALSSVTDGKFNADGSYRSLFQKVDYISSVSGGSYAACGIAGRIIREGIKSPLSKIDDERGSTYLSLVRGNSKLLDNYGGIIANWLYGLISGIVIILPFLLTLAALQVAIFQDDLKLDTLISSYGWYFQVIAAVGAVAYLSIAIVLSWLPRALNDVVAVWQLIASLGLFGVFVGLQPILIRTNLPGGALNDYFHASTFLGSIQALGIQEIAIPLALFFVLASILLALFVQRERFLRKQNAGGRSIVYRVGIQVSLLAIFVVGPMFLWSIVLMFSRWGISCGACPTEHHYSPEIVFRGAKALNDWLLPRYSAVGLEEYFAVRSAILPAFSYSVLYILAAIVLFILMKYVVDSNESSFHRYYRDRIRSCFFPDKFAAKATSTDAAERTPQLSRLKQCNGPYLLVNCTLNAKANIGGKWKIVDEPFVIGSCYAGSKIAGYTETESLENDIGRDFDLATIAAISGAAFSPVMGNYTIPSFRLLMSALSLRLGYWIPNPRKIHAQQNDGGGNLTPFANLIWRPGRRVDGIYFVKEMFGLLSARSKFLYITDGGHTDNSGIFELLRRRCGTIIAVDAEADPQGLYDNIVYLIELARSRLGIEITLSCRMVGVQDGTHCAIGEISYPPAAPDLAGTAGRLVYCKLSLTGDENWDLLCRRRASGEFPYHSTINQNYDELLFNAYRVLGTHILEGVFTGRDRVEFPDGKSQPLSSDEIESLFHGGRFGVAAL